jgi:hypothetical protein
MQWNWIRQPESPFPYTMNDGVQVPAPRLDHTSTAKWPCSPHFGNSKSPLCTNTHPAAPHFVEDNLERSKNDVPH